MSTVDELLDAQRKLVLPYLQRADEVQHVDPKVAYYCRLWAVDQTLKIPARHKEIDIMLSAVLGQLEAQKPTLVLHLATDKYHCQNFATNILYRANAVDSGGNANLDTAKAFYAAAIFIDSLRHFGELDPELSEAMRHALLRAADIQQAVREGRPAAPPQGYYTPSMIGSAPASSMGSVWAPAPHAAARSSLHSSGLLPPRAGGVSPGGRKAGSRRALGLVALAVAGAAAVATAALAGRQRPGRKK